MFWEKKNKRTYNNLSGIFSGWSSTCYLTKDHTEENSKQRFFPIRSFLILTVRAKCHAGFVSKLFKKNRKERRNEERKKERKEKRYSNIPLKLWIK